MAKKSAGLLVYHYDAERILKVLLVHPGGPFFTKKDDGVWSIPKGEYDDPEDALTVALREFTEETGNTLTSKKFMSIGSVKIKSGKVITAWCVDEYFEKPFLKSNLFEMEWPPKSGKMQWFPETDNARWFTINEARTKMYESQHPFLENLLHLIEQNEKD